MRITTIEARDLSEAFFRTCRSILRDGHIYKIDSGSFKGTKRLEFDYVTIRIEHPSIRPLVPDVPIGIPQPTNADYIDEYVSYLVTEDKQLNEQYTYGSYLTSQIDTVIETYKKYGEGNNQLCMRIGDMYSMELEDPPCLVSIDTRIRYGKLHFIVYFRSWDLYSGFPSNLGGIQLVKEYMASMIGIEDGEIIASSKGLHLYEYQWEFAKMAGGY